MLMKLGVLRGRRIRSTSPSAGEPGAFWLWRHGDRVAGKPSGDLCHMCNFHANLTHRGGGRKIGPPRSSAVIYKFVELVNA